MRQERGFKSSFLGYESKPFLAGCGEKGRERKGGEGTKKRRGKGKERGDEKGKEGKEGKAEELRLFEAHKSKVLALQFGEPPKKRVFQRNLLVYRHDHEIHASTPPEAELFRRQRYISTHLCRCPGEHSTMTRAWADGLKPSTRFCFTRWSQKQRRRPWASPRSRL